ncbi:hypothetical protein VP01_4282g3, partial [Puccinia sorghi]
SNGQPRKLTKRTTLEMDAINSTILKTTIEGIPMLTEENFSTCSCRGRQHNLVCHHNRQAILYYPQQCDHLCQQRQCPRIVEGHC